jgi:hypothetical protein
LRATNNDRVRSASDLIGIAPANREKASSRRERLNARARGTTIIDGGRTIV